MERTIDAGAGTAATTLKWVGDSISFDATKPATIEFKDGGGRSSYLSVLQTLVAAKQIDTYGLGRITSALGFAAENGYLCAQDLNAWQQWQKDRC